MLNISISQKRLQDILGKIGSVKILVIGDVMLDEYVSGEATRISPEAPVPVIVVEEVTTRLGGAANVVQNLASLGVTPFLASVVGKDTIGAKLIETLNNIGCDTGGCFISPYRPTIQKTRIIARQQQVVRLDREQTSDLSKAEFDEYVKPLSGLLAKANAVIVSDYAKGVVCEQVLKHLFSLAQNESRFIAVDPKERHFNLYTGASVITPNLKEAHLALGVPFSRHLSYTEICDLGWKLLNKINLPYLLLTLSERGMILFERDSHTYTHLPTVAKKVFDVTGAGDTVISVFTAAISCGATPVEAAFIANHAAGITVGELGTASVTLETLMHECIA